MKKRTAGLLGALLVTLTFSTTASGDGGGFSKASFWSWWASSRYQTADVKSLPFFQNVGAVTLVRERNKISGRIMANVARLPGPEADPPTPGGGRAQTVWLIVVNNPSKCAIPTCLSPMDADLLNPATRTTIFNATGAIVQYDDDGNGVVNADFAVEAGRLPNGLFILEGSQRALYHGNGFKALVIVVIDQHPPLEPGESWIYDLTTTETPGGPNNASVTLSVFLPCPEATCPADPFAPPP